MARPVGNVTRRGRNSWRLKYEASSRQSVTGKRDICYLTIRGTEKEARAELRRLTKYKEAYPDCLLKQSRALTRLLTNSVARLVSYEERI